ncbi:Glucomannan 4-beta-mannosyltransferase [Bertholletia excelsa]
MDWVLNQVLPEIPVWKKGEVLEEAVFIWGIIKGYFIIPVLQGLVIFWFAMSLMLALEGAYTGIVAICLRLIGRNSSNNYKWEPMKDDAEFGSSAYPMVLVQIPMYNELEVYRLSIAAACGLSWPSDRLIIQVLDGSTDPAVRDKVGAECKRWESEGVNIKHEVRDNRDGFKAGALKLGMSYEYARRCDYVAIFDADFEPDPDFLRRTVPFLVHNPNLALVQARWKFGNADECLMTRIQTMSQDYHFKVEQEVGSFIFAFFGYNGSAGVWRNVAIEDAGGWRERTTVEDTDLAVRAFLQGWKFLYLASVEVNSELPSTFKAFRSQQHRWSSGLANLFRKMLIEIITNKKVCVWKRAYVIYSFFFVRKILAPIVPFVYFCIVIPAAVLLPEVHVPAVGAVSIVFIITLLNLVGTPRSVPLLILWLPFENIMSMHRTKAAIMGLAETRGVNEWVVTEKVGQAPKSQSNSQPIRPVRPRFCSYFTQRVNRLELCMGVYLLGCGCYELAFGGRTYFPYLFFQAIAFFVVGFGFVGKFIPTSHTELC